MSYSTMGAPLDRKCNLAARLICPTSGVMLTPVEKLTAQGYDMQFGTNVLVRSLLLYFYLLT